jgi:hypothetical protein
MGKTVLVSIHQDPNLTHGPGKAHVQSLSWDLKGGCKVPIKGARREECSRQVRDPTWSLGYYYGHSEENTVKAGAR